MSQSTCEDDSDKGREEVILDHHHYQDRIKQSVTGDVLDAFFRSNSSGYDVTATCVNFQPPEQITGKFPYVASSGSSIITLDSLICDAVVSSQQVRLLAFCLTLDGLFPAHMVPTLRNELKQAAAGPDVPNRVGRSFFHKPGWKDQKGSAPHPINAQYAWGVVFFCGHDHGLVPARK
jgi:hypothetical protein